MYTRTHARTHTNNEDIIYIYIRFPQRSKVKKKNYFIVLGVKLPKRTRLTFSSMIFIELYPYRASVYYYFMKVYYQRSPI